ncbi:hypothetical protein [Hansschlegelia sp. KR7-227]|uniref:hypothetical protein n=1 Tax=Hansschlegelia sp. KR7-227 TaxID=3400914 RepID=UPI003C001295
MASSNSERNDTPAGRSKNRTILMVVIGLFVAGLIGVFVWGNALVPTSRDGELNSRPVDGSTGVKPQSF